MKLMKPKSPWQWWRLYRLYMQAFPAAERKPFGMIVKMYRRGKTDVWYLEEAGNFAGLAATLNGDNAILLDYFAVEKSRRGQGIGRAALKEILRTYQGKGVFLEIESTQMPAPDRAQRLRRKAFYLSCGMEEMGVMVKLFGVDMELLGKGCRMDFAGYRAFYREHYSQWASEHIEMG